MASGLSTTLMDLNRPSTGRVAWADIAKAFSIILVVLWTTIGDSLRISELLVLVRMPLFFFVSGLFAYRVVTATSFRELLRDKFTNLVYLYVLWETLLFLGRGVVGHFALGWDIHPGRQLTILWDPLLNQWFLYALAWAFLVSWLLRRVPVLLVLMGALILYGITVASGEWRHLPFVERIIRLFPFFWLGLIARPLLALTVERWWKLWPLVLPAFFAAAHLVWATPVAALAPVTFAVSLTGILGFVLLARQVAVIPWIGKAMTIVGASTLYVYVMHKLFLFYAHQLVNITGISVPMYRVTMALAAIAVCTLAGRWMSRQRIFNWLFSAPWVKARPAAAQTTRSAGALSG